MAATCVNSDYYIGIYIYKHDYDRDDGKHQRRMLKYQQQCIYLG